MKTAKKIEITWDDGSVSFAEGDAAKQIMEWWRSCEVMNMIHGAQYKGPKLRSKRKRFRRARVARKGR